MKVTILYFASLRDASRVASEVWETSAADLRTLYDEVQSRHGIPFPSRQLRVAMDGEFVHWTDAPRDGAEVAFIPPVSGG
ncbi:MoaD/ThiS family protein [Lysobacter fragariae]